MVCVSLVSRTHMLKKHACKYAIDLLVLRLHMSDPSIMQVIMSLLEAKMEKCVGLTWTFHLDLIGSLGMTLQFINTTMKGYRVRSILLEMRLLNIYIILSN